MNKQMDTQLKRQTERRTSRLIQVTYFDKRFGIDQWMKKQTDIQTD